MRLQPRRIHIRRKQDLRQSAILGKQQGSQQSRESIKAAGNLGEALGQFPESEDLSKAGTKGREDLGAGSGLGTQRGQRR